MGCLKALKTEYRSVEMIMMVELKLKDSKTVGPMALRRELLMVDHFQWLKVDSKQMVQMKAYHWG